MSSTLMWKPNEREGSALSYDLKIILSRKVWGTDGSTGGDYVVIGSEYIGYLDGLDDAGVKGASELLKAIKEHGEVVIWHRH